MNPYKLPTRTPELLPDFVASMPADGAGQLCIFDADGTLWRDDVADDFCRWTIDQGHVDTGDLWPEYLRIYRDDHAVGCEFMLRFYGGLELGVFHELNAAWWLQADRNWVPEVLEAIYTLAERGYTLWIVTGSPTDTMLPVLDFLPFDRVVGMDFEVEEGIITGRLSGIACTDQGKADAVIHHWGSDKSIALAAGNGSLDAAMIGLGDVRWSVFPNPKFERFSREQCWHILPRPTDFEEEAKLA